MKTNQQTATWISGLFITSLLIFPGCYPDWPEHAGNAEVHGQVTLDGAPILQAKVVFIPIRIKSDSGRIMPIAYGLTNAEGEFELQYADKSKELIAGIYDVIISKTETHKRRASTTTGNSDLSFKEGQAEQFLPPAFMNSPMFGNRETIPTIYNRESTLTCTVLASPSIFRPKFELNSVDPLLRSTTK